MGYTAYAEWESPGVRLFNVLMRCIFIYEGRGSAPSRRLGVTCLLLAAVLTSFPSRAATVDPVDFNFHVRPLLSDRCYSCHGPDERARKAKLRLDTPEGLRGKTQDGAAIVVAGNRAQSELWRRITTHDAEDLMPPAESHLKLSAMEIENLGRWIDEGAHHKLHWSFNSLVPVPVPSPSNQDSWMRNEIDAFVRDRLDRIHLKPTIETPREQWLRRVSFDLTGLPPTIEDIDAFLADRSADAYEKAADRLLASPAYGERMASEWLDLARYADTYGYQADVDRDLSPWRDWVIRSANENLPYDQFVLWQIAGDLLPNPTRDQSLATAFNRLHRQTNEGGSVEEEFRTEYVADRVHTVGTTFLGLTFECSRCHDHKFDPISQRDYYRMSAFFNNIDESGLYSHFTQAVPTPTLVLYSPSDSELHAELITKMAAAETDLKRVEAEAKDRFSSWLKGVDVSIPAVKPVAAFHFDEIVTNRFLNSANEKQPATLVENPALVEGRTGKAVRFSGDDSVICRGVGHFGRTDPFTIGCWIRPTETQERAIVLHHSRAWTDSGSRGYQWLIEKGRPEFALIHFWPGDAIAVRAIRSLPLNQWSQITVTYDGSSRAAGLTLYLDGELLETEVIRDNLYKDIQHRAEWGDGEVGGIDLTLGGRFRDSGFRNGEIDDLQVFDVRLTQEEVRQQWVLPSASAATLSRAFPEYLQRLDADYRRALSELKSLRDQENKLISGVREIMVMKEMEKRRPTYVLKRGSYSMPSDPVEPGVPERIFPFAEELPKNRLGFARWLIDPRHPLTARVAVNRIWKLHFGRGLVASVEDFGAQGQLPTHPELLDWMAERFIRSGWNRKALQRLIVLSATYRQSSQASAEAISADPENRWLARGPKHRLSAEQVRDQALAVSGLLVNRVGGPSVKPYQPAGVWEDSGTGKSYTQDKGEKLYRRSLYTFWRRTAPPPSMMSFDAGSREVCTAKREITATPLQSLVLLNDVQFIEASRVLAEQLTRAHPTDLDARFEDVFRRMTSRRAEPREREILRKLYDQQLIYYRGRPEAADQLLSVGDRPRDMALAPMELAATTLLVSALMNHDEFVIKR